MFFCLVESSQRSTASLFLPTLELLRKSREGEELKPRTEQDLLLLLFILPLFLSLTRWCSFARKWCQLWEGKASPRSFEAGNELETSSNWIEKEEEKKKKENMKEKEKVVLSTPSLSFAASSGVLSMWRNWANHNRAANQPANELELEKITNKPANLKTEFNPPRFASQPDSPFLTAVIFVVVFF